MTTALARRGPVALVKAPRNARRLTPQEREVMRATVAPLVKRPLTDAQIVAFAEAFVRLVLGPKGDR